MKPTYFFLLALILRSLLVFGQTAGAAYHPTKYAFVVGVSQYNDKSGKFPRLDYPKSDADRFYEFLLRSHVGVRRENITKLTDDSARWAIVDVRLGQWLNDLEGKVKGGDQVYIYWSGHGAVSKSDQLLVCYDTKYLENNDWGVGRLSSDIRIGVIKSKIGSIVSEKGVKVFLIVDACRTKLPGVEETTAVTTLTQIPDSDGDVYMYSSSIGGSSFETNKLVPGSSVFTYFLLLGLNGGADNSPRDNTVTLGEIKTFLHHVGPYSKNILKKNPGQTPFVIYRETGDDELPLTSNIPASVATTNREKAAALLKLIEAGGAPRINVSDVIRSKGKRMANETGHTVPLPPLSLRKEVNDLTLAPQRGDNELYDSVISKIAQHTLVRPVGHSAYDYFQRLQQSSGDSLAVRDARIKLIISLQEKSQDFIEAYLSGDLVQSSKEFFDVASEEVARAIELRPKNDPLKIDLLPKLYFLQARAFAGSNNPVDWNKGLYLIDSALQLEKTAYMYHTKGILYQNKSRYFSAIRLFDSALLLAPNWQSAKFNLATTYFMIQEYGNSIRILKQMQEKDPRNSRVYSWLAYNYETISDNKRKILFHPSYRSEYQKAIDLNYKALQTDSTNVYAYLNLGRIFFKLAKEDKGNLERAKYFFGIGGLQYDYGQCQTWLAQIYEREGALDSARFYYENAHRISPHDTAALNNYAEFLYRHAAPAKADSVFKAALLHTLNKEYGRFDYKFLSKFRQFVFKTQSPAAADNIFAQLVDLNDEDPYVFIEHSRQYEEIDSLTKARDILCSGTKHIEQSPSLNYALAQLYFTHRFDARLGPRPLDSAARYLQLVRTWSPQYSLLYYGLGQVYGAKDQPDSARWCFRMADSLNNFVEHTQNFSHVLLNAGDTLVRKGDFGKALTFYKNANDGSDQKFNGLMRIANTYYLEGQLDSAAWYCNKARRYIPANGDEEDSTVTSRVELQTALDALIRYDRGGKKELKSALHRFRELDNHVRREPLLLEQALCYYKLNDQKRALSILKKKKANVAKAYEKIMALSNIFYSEKFVRDLNELLPVK